MGELISFPYRSSYQHISEYFEVLSELEYNAPDVSFVELLRHYIPVDCIFKGLRLGVNPGEEEGFSSYIDSKYPGLSATINGIMIIIVLASTRSIIRQRHASSARLLTTEILRLLKSMLIGD